ncbi:unnamed protein product [Lactuca virosa]|uniref:Uncharacterized protein n=1 Tax=Lactuca virosa TaxID=75947 RepID=A0AAU9P3E4_9ASTR|nr:unnamed protein product [Lactuca virosa]
MEDHRRQKPNSTVDIFTFPAMPRDMESESELADQLFSNGKLLLHAFPVQPTNCIIPRSMILSRTSSISSKGSLMSSRSNSTNSRSSSSNSSCSSARTSTSEGSSRRKLQTIDQSRSVAIKTTNTGTRFPKKDCQTRYYCNGYGNSQRWQFMAPVPVLNRRNSLKKRKGGKGKRDGGVRKGFCRRFFGWLVSTCQECHAIEPSKRLKVSM